MKKPASTIGQPSARAVGRLSLLLSLLGFPSICLAAGGANISAIALGLITTFSPLWIAIATIAIVAAGMGLILTQDDGRLAKVKGVLVAVVIGGITVNLVIVLGPTLIGYVYNGVGTFQGNAAGLGIEAEGVAGWVMSLSAISGVLMIILAMVEAVASLGADESAYQKVRAAVIHVVLGLIVIIGAGIIRAVFFVSHEPTPLLYYLMKKITLVLAFITFIAVAILIYAGFRMVISFGREEDYSAAKGLALRVIVGILVLLLSLSLVAIVTAVLGG